MRKDAPDANLPLPARAPTDRKREFVTNEITLRCIEIVGGYAYAETELLEKWGRNSKIFDIFEGTHQIQVLVISSSRVSCAARPALICADLSEPHLSLCASEIFAGRTSTANPRSTNRSCQSTPPYRASRMDGRTLLHS
jgi:hypothetical protein